jgi:ABC-type multidrug transport system fused ATPase/permease subunit
VKGQLKQSFFQRTALIFKPFWKYFGVMTALLFSGQILAAFSPYLFGRTVDAVMHKNGRLIIVSLILAFVCTLMKEEILAYFRERVETKHLGDYIEQYFLKISLSKMLAFSVGQHTNEHSGVQQSIVNRGQGALSNMMNVVVFTILPNCLLIVATIGILAFVAWQVALVSGISVALYVLIAYRRNKRSFANIDGIRKRRQKQSKLQSELFRNSTLVIAEAQESRAESDFGASATEFLNFTEHTWLTYLDVFYKHKIIIIIGQYLSLIVGVYLIFEGHLSAGTFVALFSWVSTIFGNLILIMNMQRQVLFQAVEIRKLYDLLDLTPDVDPNVGGVTIPALKGEICFHNVGFSYPQRLSVLEDEEEPAEKEIQDERAVSEVTFTIPAGAKVGFVGSSGSGKSTIINLMRRYYDPIEGQINIDGVNLHTLDLHWLRSHIGNVEQKIDLFDRSVRDNILFGVPNNIQITDELLNSAIRDASLDTFISKLKNGLDTMIGENGIKVSGGERQRIGIARALIKNPKILIFDEATSALDSVNEKLIHEAINRGAEGRTTIIIAHRLSTVIDADIIFVVSEGSVVDHGTHHELSKRSSDYQKLIKNQIF